MAPSVSAATRAAFTLPILAGLSARVEDRTIIASAKQKAMKEGIFQPTKYDGFDTVTFRGMGCQLPKYRARIRWIAQDKQEGFLKLYL